MKSATVNHLSKYFAIVLVSLSAFGCSRALTKSDVLDNLEDAREATVETQEKSQAAIESRQQFYADYKLTRVRVLEDRIKQVDKRIGDLKKTAKKSANDAAIRDMQSAIAELEKEKKDLNREINQVQAIQERDWTQSSEVIKTAVTQIQAELDKLSQSLEGYEEADK